jgi:hypothetical protein
LTSLATSTLRVPHLFNDDLSLISNQYHCQLLRKTRYLNTGMPSRLTM